MRPRGVLSRALDGARHWQDPGPRLAVAVSGGRDSTALLHATVRQALGCGVHVHALHVHHGLMPQADAWWQHAQAQCQRWARRGLPVSFHGRRLNTKPSPGDSVEAWARRERYRVLAEMASELEAGIVLLAHHRRDQAETVLLQALRGSGAAGLSAMPDKTEREGIVWIRPWLHMPAHAVEAYVKRYRLAFVVDPSNAHARFARSRLRAQVWPAFGRAFPGAEAALDAVARRMQEAQACLVALAEADANGGAVVDGGLALAAWTALSSPRRANVLRHWAQSWSHVGLPESLLERLLLEVPASRPGAQWPAPGGTLRRDRTTLRFVAS